MADNQPIIHRRRGPANKLPESTREAIIRLCREGKTVKEIRSAVLCGYTAIYNVLHNAGLRPSNTQWKMSEEDQQAICNDYRSGKPIGTIANERGFKSSTVHGILLRREILEPKVCKRCKSVGTDRRYNLCPDCRKDKWADKEGRRRQRLHASGRCTRCMTANDRLPAKTCSGCRAKVTANNRRIKETIVNAYGGACACCGETILEFLTIDHVNNDGKAKRLQGEPSGNGLYARLLKAGCPTEYQILCFNCNHGRFFCGGKCPHETLGKTP